MVRLIASQLRGLFKLGQRFLTKLILLLIAFIAVPIILYGVFESADRTRNDLLRRSVEQEGRLIAVALRPLLEDFRGAVADQLPKAMEELADGRARVKLLFRPRTASISDGFLYVASSPAVPNAYLEEERTELLRAGLMAALSTSCSGNQALAHKYTNPAGREEVLTSITPINVRAGCWVILVSHAADQVDPTWGRPYWQAPEVRTAAIAYLLLAAIVIWMFVVIWQNLRRFERFARRFRKSGMETASFGSLNRIPELMPVVGELDRLIQSLQGTADRMRDAAEEHAHALKGPLGVISQSLEPLRSTSMTDPQRRMRAVELIERSVDRLDVLVSAARQMDLATAESLVPQFEVIDLGRFAAAVASGYEMRNRRKDVRILVEMSDSVRVDADADLLETSIENLLDNAASFSPEGSTITVAVSTDGSWAIITISDQGPGVPQANTERIFERYFSQRSADHSNVSGNFGIGLWIVRRNAEAMGGGASAFNRENGGLTVQIRLPRSMRGETQ